MPPGASVLDWATGTGRHAVYLAKRGADVTAIDQNAAAIEAGRRLASDVGVSVNWVCSNLETDPVPSRAFDVVLVFNYLDRPRFPAILDSVRPGGLIIAETFLTWQRVFNWGPTDSAHLLEPGELARLVDPYHVLHAREVLESYDSKVRAIASVIAQRPKLT